MSKEEKKVPVTQEAIDRVKKANERNPEPEREEQIKRMEKAFEKQQQEATDKRQQDTSDGSGKTYMTPEAASRIQSFTARQNDGRVDKGSFASRAQSSGDTNVNKGLVPPRGEGGK